MQLRTHNGHALFDALDLSAPDKDCLHTSLTQVVADELKLAAKDSRVTLDQWVIFPDALHALITLPESGRDRVTRMTNTRNITSGKPRRLTSFIAGLKAVTAKRINLLRNQPGSPVWQRSYKEQLIEDDLMLFRLKKSISESDSIVMCG